MQKSLFRRASRPTYDVLIAGTFAAIRFLSLAAASLLAMALPSAAQQCYQFTSMSGPGFPPPATLIVGIASPPPPIMQPDGYAGYNLLAPGNTATIVQGSNVTHLSSLTEFFAVVSPQGFELYVLDSSGNDEEIILSSAAFLPPYSLPAQLPPLTSYSGTAFSGTFTGFDTPVGQISSSCVVMPSPRITFNGADVTGTTQTVVVGEQIQLTGSFPESVGPSIISQRWSVPGTLYSVPLAIGRTGELITMVTPNELTSATATFNWIDSVEGRQVTYKVTFSNGQTASAQVTFNILQPTPTDPTKPLLTGVIGSANVTGYFGQSLNLVNTALNQQGMVITPNLAPPPGFSGSTTLLQVGAGTATETFLSSGETIQCVYPYAYDNLYQSPPEGDSPGAPLPSSLQALSLIGSFQTYLLWTPNLPHAIPAPLGFLAWSWSGRAARSSSSVFASWALQPGGTQDIQPFVAMNSYPPPWTTYLNGETATCSSVEVH